MKTSSIIIAAAALAVVALVVIWFYGQTAKNTAAQVGQNYTSQALGLFTSLAKLARSLFGGGNASSNQDGANGGTSQVSAGVDKISDVETEDW